VSAVKELDFGPEKLLRVAPGSFRRASGAPAIFVDPSYGRVMPDQSPPVATACSGTDAEPTDARKPFAAPSVEDLGALQALTQEFGGYGP
jgi:hypothetical protein